MLATPSNHVPGLRFTLRGLLAAVCALAVVGCSHTVGYETTAENVDLAPHRLPVRVAVIRMTDLRAQDEVKTDSAFLSQWDSSEDSDFDDADLPAAISEMTAKHLDASGIFAKVTYVPDVPSKMDDSALAKLRALGFDAVVVASIEHFSGNRRWDLARSGLFMLAGPIGSAANLALGHRAGGLVTFNPISVVSTTTGLVVWTGMATGDYQTTTYITGTAPGYANEALKVALNDFSHRLDGESGDLAARLTVRREEVAGPAVPAEESDPSIFERALNPAKAGVKGAAKAASKAGEAVDKVFDGIFGGGKKDEEKDEKQDEPK